MGKKLIYLIFFNIQLISATLTLNIAKDDHKLFSVLHLRDKQDIECSIHKDNNFTRYIICKLHSPITKRDTPVEDRYFKIYFSHDLVKITPKKSFKLYSVDDEFLSSNIVKREKRESSKHWIAVGYRSPNRVFDSELHAEGLNFPIEYRNFKLPFIGELDFDRRPKIPNEDSRLILNLKELYKKGNYERVISKVDEFFESTDKRGRAFESELLLYKIRSLDRVINDSKTNPKYDPNELVELADSYIKSNPSSINLPEVYMIVAKSYISMGRKKLAKKYMDILDSEYKDSRFNFLLKLFVGDNFYKQGESSQAKAAYKDVLYNTQDFDLASMAAMKLADIYLDQKRVKKAKNFIEKVLDANAKFITKETPLSYKIAKKFADLNSSDTAIKLSKLFKKSGDRDEIDKDIAYWYELNGDIDRAITLYREYLEKRKDSKYLNFVKKRLDSLLINDNETNQTKALKHIDTILKKYDDNETITKALLQKVKILKSQKRFEDILKLEESLKKIGRFEIVKESASTLSNRYYSEGRCKEGYALESKYDINITVSKDKLFDCYKKLHLYKRAIKIVRELSNGDNLNEKIKWGYELVKLYSKLLRDKELLLVAYDVENLQKALHTTKYRDIVFDKIEAFYRLGNYDDLMLREIKKAEKFFPSDVRLLDAYNRALEYSKKIHNTNMVEIYAKKMLKLQDRYKIDTYSPKVDIDLVEALRENGKYQEALREDLKLLYKKLDDNQRAHVLYLAGYLSEKLKKIKEAKEFYIKCGEIVEDSAWVELCSENLKLLEE
jgi:tetratricopeptide (TPR) repeat protein